MFFVRSTGEAFVIDSAETAEVSRVVAKLEARGVAYERVVLGGRVCRLRALGLGHLDVTTIPNEGLFL